MSRIAWTLTMAAGLATFLVADARAQSAPPARTTTVGYLAGGSVYVEAGEAQGLARGDTLDVLDGGAVIARLVVTFTSSRRASCDTLWTRRPIAVGDVVRLASRAGAPSNAPGVPDTTARDTTTTSPSGGSTYSPGARAAPRRLRGRVGVGWLSVSGSDGTRFRQPSLAIRLDGRDIGDDHVELAVDMRSRVTSRDFGGVSTTDQYARFYRGALTVRSLNGHQRLTLGRQSSPTLASINLFDGALLELGTDRHSFGVFSGTQPDPISMGLSGDILQSGAYFEMHQAPRTERRWTVALGGVTSEQNGQPNRDFLFAQGWWFSRAMSATLSQEVDVNRGWKRALGEPALSATSTFATARVPVTPWLAFDSGYDNRRSVRLYRDRLTPETQFDDQYREGGWLGAQLALLDRVRVGGESRANTGSDRSHSWTGNFELYRFAPLLLTVRGRASHFYGETVDSRLESTSVGLEPARGSRVELAGGVRKSTGTFVAGDDSERWQSVDLDVALGRRWYSNGGWERDYGGIAGDTRQFSASVSLSF